MTTPAKSVPARRSSVLSSPWRLIAVGLLASTVLLVGTACAGASPVELVGARSSATPTPTPTPEITYKNEPVLAQLPFAAVTVDDPNATVGTTTPTVAGVPGVETTTYRVTYVDGVETARDVLSQVVTTAPIDAVTAVGSKPVPVPVAKPAPAPAPVAAGGGCDPNYSGQCVPIASDVDCAGGSGNGPAYTAGPVRVVGTDVYDLDRDGDGIACD